MTVDLDDLQRRADAARPGPWFEDDYPLWTTDVISALGGNVCRVSPPNAEADAAFIAAANPATVLALIGELRTARADADQLATAIKDGDLRFERVNWSSERAERRLAEALEAHTVAVRGRTDGATP